MMTSLTCSDVRRESVDGKEYVVVIASQDKCAGESAVPVDTSGLAKAKATLAVQNVVLGGPLSVSQKRVGQGRSFSKSPLQLTASDDCGMVHHFMAERMEECNLSSGSTLLWFFITADADALNWLVGRRIEVVAEQPATQAAGVFK